MKKTFVLSHPKIKLARLFDAAKHDAKKYLKRERKKALPSGMDFWDFDCKFGLTEEDAKVIHLGDINKSIDEVEKQGLNTFYLEIIAKPAQRFAKPEDELDFDD